MSTRGVEEGQGGDVGSAKLPGSDNHPEFVCDAVAEWAQNWIGLIFIPPGQPWRNGYVESFHARQLDGCLNMNRFYSLLHAQVVIADWNKEYNTIRRHSSLGKRPQPNTLSTARTEIT